jgi:hypothetical protein
MKSIEKLNKKYNDLVQSANIDALLQEHAQEWFDKNPVVVSVDCYTRLEYDDEGYSGYFQIDPYDLTESVVTFQDGASEFELESLAESFIEHMETYGTLAVAMNYCETDSWRFENKIYEK